MRPNRKVVLIAILGSLVLGVCLAAAVAAGVARLWPLARAWTVSALGGRDAPLSLQATQLADRLLQLRRGGLDGAALAALAGQPGLGQLLKLIENMPALAPLVQDGAYRTALQEAARQNVRQIAEVKLEQVASPEVRDAVTRIQQALESAPPGAQAAGTVDQAVLDLLKTEAFIRLLGRPGVAAKAKSNSGFSEPRPEGVALVAPLAAGAIDTRAQDAFAPRGTFAGAASSPHISPACS